LIALIINIHTLGRMLAAITGTSPADSGWI